MLWLTIFEKGADSGWEAHKGAFRSVSTLFCTIDIFMLERIDHDPSRRPNSQD